MCICRAVREAEAKAEQQAMQTNLRGLPEGEEKEPAKPSLLPAVAGGDEAIEGQDLNTVLRRMKEVARVLEHFQSLREPGRSRSDYMEQVASASFAMLRSIMQPFLWRFMHASRICWKVLSCSARCAGICGICSAIMPATVKTLP
jgi:hypothetical protein